MYLYMAPVITAAYLYYNGLANTQMLVHEVPEEEALWQEHIVGFFSFLLRQ